MPQHRTLLHEAPTWRVERVAQHAQPPHWSTTYRVDTERLVMPMAGATEFRVGDAAVLLDPITVLGLPAGQPYQMKPVVDSMRTSIVVSARLGEPLQVTGDTWVLTPPALWQLRCHWRGLARGDAAPAATSVVLRAALALARPAVRRGHPGMAAVQRAQRFMAQQLGQTGEPRWTLHDVADAACCSPFHLARRFRQHTGLSVHAWRQRLRLAAALQRLEEGERSLSALAFALGFSSQSHLGAVFQRELGVTPARAKLMLAP